jgi:hypothetical protein
VADRSRPPNQAKLFSPLDKHARGLAHFPFEDAGKMVGISKTHAQGNIFNLTAAIHEPLGGAVDFLAD